MVVPAVRLLAGVLALAAMLAPMSAARAEVAYPSRIGQRDFIADNAGMIEPADLAAIKDSCGRLLDQRGIALIVVTIDSLRSFGAEGWPIERYAMNLFAEWGIGQPAQSRGVLLLVSKGDRKVRIELGSGWSRENDAAASAVIANTIVPRFKAGRFSQGIREGVDDLASRLGESPTSARAPPPVGLAPRPIAVDRPLNSLKQPSLSPGVWICLGVGVLLVIALVVVTAFRGARGGATPGPIGFGAGGMPGYGPYGWGGGGNSWGGLIPGILLGNYLGSRGPSSSNDAPRHSAGSDPGGSFGGGSFGGGGFSSGGSFGGGFSGGGGSTGSW